MLLLRADPKDAALRSIAAESLRALGELDRSRDHWMRAIEVAPDEANFASASPSPSTTSGTTPPLKAAERARKLGAEAGEVDYYAALCRLAARRGSPAADSRPPIPPALQGGGPAAHVRPRRSPRIAPDGPDLSSGWFEKVLCLAPDHELSLLYRIAVAESLEDGDARERLTWPTFTPIPTIRS